MLNEEKIKLMTKLAVYEEKEGKKFLKSNKYYKNDYISINMISTAIAITIAYLLAVVIVLLCKMDFYDEMTNNDIITTVKSVGIIYVVVMVIFLLISYIFYSVRYDKIKEQNLEYADNLKRLYLVYKKEEKNKNEAKLGGDYSDDETFGF